MIIAERKERTPFLEKSPRPAIVEGIELKKPKFGTGFKLGLLAQEAIAQPRAPTTRQKCIS